MPRVAPPNETVGFLLVWTETEDAERVRLFKFGLFVISYRRRPLISPIPSLPPWAYIPSKSIKTNQPKHVRKPHKVCPKTCQERGQKMPWCSFFGFLNPFCLLTRTGLGFQFFYIFHDSVRSYFHISRSTSLKHFVLIPVYMRMPITLTVWIYI